MQLFIKLEWYLNVNSVLVCLAGARFHLPVPQLVSLVPRPPPPARHHVVLPLRPAAPALPAAAVAEREGSGVPRSSQ